MRTLNHLSLAKCALNITYLYSKIKSMVFLVLQMIDIEEGFLSLMDETGDVRSDIRVPDNDIGKEIKAKHEADGDYLVTILKAMGTEAAIAVKMMSK